MVKLTDRVRVRSL